MNKDKFKTKPDGFQSFRPVAIQFQQGSDTGSQVEGPPKPFVVRNMTNEFHIDYPELLAKIRKALAFGSATPQTQIPPVGTSQTGVQPLIGTSQTGLEEEADMRVLEKEAEEEEEETGVLTLAPSLTKRRRNLTGKVQEEQGTLRQPPVPRVAQIDTLVLNGEEVGPRLPKDRLKIRMATSPYYSNNRKLFTDFMAKRLAPYAEKMKASLNEAARGCAGRAKGAAFELMMHQAVVRDYLNLFTPYRGLLLFHGLGSGKTCTSIAIAEGMKSEREIVLMTPASLNPNFFSELRKCGDPLYKLNQFWEFVSVRGAPENETVLSQLLFLPLEHIRAKGGAWMVDVRKEPNYQQLSTQERDQVDEQVDRMIRGKYIDINYNGLSTRSKKWIGLTNGGKVNPFHNRVVLIDEVHKFVSVVVNKLRLPERSRTTSPPYLIYKWLMEAENCRVVFLSGTPMINYPNEIAVLFNMLRGYIQEWSVGLSPGHGLTAERVEAGLEQAGFRSFDVVRLGNDNMLRITRNPFGFVRGGPNPELTSSVRKEKTVVKPVQKTVAKAVPETVAKAVPETVAKTVPETVSKPGGRSVTGNGLEGAEGKGPKVSKPSTTRKQLGGREPTRRTLRTPSVRNTKTVDKPEEEVVEPVKKPQLESDKEEPIVEEDVKEEEPVINVEEDEDKPVSEDETPVVSDVQKRLADFQRKVGEFGKQVEEGRGETVPSVIKNQSHDISKHRSENALQEDMFVAVGDPDASEPYVVDRETNPVYSFASDVNANPYDDGENPYRAYGGAGSGQIVLDETGNLDDRAWAAALTEVIRAKGWVRGSAPLKVERFTALPDQLKEFADKFMKIDSTTYKMSEFTNRTVFQKRILGLTSFFRSDQEALMPKFVLTEKGKDYEEVRVDMSDYQFGKYIEVRGEEVSREAKKKTKVKGPTNGAEAQADHFDKNSTYRIFSRASCNFVFPEDIDRPYPTVKQKGETGAKSVPGIVGGDGDGDDDEGGDLSDAEPLLSFKKDFGGGEGEDEEDDELDRAFQAVNTAQKVVKAAEATKDENGQEAVDQRNIAADPATGQEVMPNKGVANTKGEVMEDVPAPEGERAEDEDLAQGDPAYQKALTQAMTTLQRNKGKYLSEDGLKTYSPKFLRIVQSIRDPANRGCHLVYSQFRSVEGIEILRYALEANGFEQFRVFKDEATGEWDCSPLTPGKRRYLLFTGTESIDQKRYLLNVYNGAWELGDVSQPILEKISAINGSNVFGEVVQVFMITSSGAEGLSLMNTRYVHIVEPYWHWVRLEQVIGRARRICSHQDLPEELRNVQVFIYLSQLSKEQRTRNREGEGSKQLEFYDASKRQLDETGQPLTLTTDQMLLEISQTKDEQNQTFLNAVRETAVDCVLYNPDGKKSGTHCFRFGSSRPTDLAFQPSLAEDLTEVPETVAVKKRLDKVPYKGVVYRVDRSDEAATRFPLYNDAAYQQGRLETVGKELVVETDAAGKQRMRIADTTAKA